MTSVRLTETVKKGGCAAKLPAGELRKVLSDLELKRPKELKVGVETMDDACLWDLGDGRLLVQTLDFFTPIVDDPFEFGAIAAANAISDVYAMGGTPATALTILAFPTQTLEMEVLKPLMQGAVQKIQEAGAVLAGGHSIDDETLKLGFSVSGFVPAARAWTNAGAKVGDVLILTKGLGTGTITTAVKIREAKSEWERSAIDSMMQLNRVTDLLDGIQVHAATDITGFGLAGHAMQMARASGVRFEIQLLSVPLLEGAMQSLLDENLNRAHKTNADYVSTGVRYSAVVEPWMKWLSVDPQTSGGLLLVIPGVHASEAIARLKNRFPLIRSIGTVTGEARDGVPSIEFEV